MPKPIPYSEEAIIEAFHEMATVGDDILLPLSLTEDTLCRKQHKRENDITSYLHRFDFGEYFFSIVYTPQRSDMTSVPSTLEVRICLDKTEPFLFFMPYDIIPYINPQDMICRYFPFIESPERLKSCYRDLCESLIPYLDDFQRLASAEETRERAYRDLKAEMTRCYGENVEAPSGKGEDYDRTFLAFRFAHFVKWKSSFYSSDAYGEFLSGDRTALSNIAFRGARPDYIKHIALSTIGAGSPDYLPVREESASLPAKIKGTKHTRSLGVIAATFAYTFPLVFLVLALLYFGVAFLVGMGSPFYTALTLPSFFNNIVWISLSAVTLSFMLYPVTLRLFFRKRHTAFAPYYHMAKAQKKGGTSNSTAYFFLIAALIVVILSATRGIQFNQTNIVIPSAPFSENTVLGYDEIREIKRTDRQDGSFYYSIQFDKKDPIVLSELMTKTSCEKIAEKLDPVFASHGLTVVTDEDTPPADSPNTTT